MGTEKTRGAGRTRSWTFILYPESAPDNWRDYLDELHLQWVESPLHDRDVNATGEPKKPHWHILVMFDSVKSFDQVRDLTEVLNAPIPQKCAGAKALVRYMAHLDNPDKAQYDAALIVGHGGADIAELLRPSSSERYALIREMLDFVRSHGITELQQLVDYAMDSRFDDWFPLLTDSCCYVVGQYIKSARHSKPQKIDPQTGEVLG